MTRRRHTWFHTDGQRVYVSIPIFGGLRLGRSFRLGWRRRN